VRGKHGPSLCRGFAERRAPGWLRIS
jgi:hypothetical protein